MKVPSLHDIRPGLLLPRIVQRLQHARPHWRLKSPRFWHRREPVHVEAPAPNLVASFRTYAKWASIIAMVAGYHVLLGWIFDIGVLTSPRPNFTATQVNSAVCAVLSGMALYFVQSPRQLMRANKRRVVALCAGIVLLIGGLSLIEYIWNVPTGVDLWLLRPLDSQIAGGPYPGRMAIATAVGYMTMAAALLLIERGEGRRWADLLTLSAAAISLLAIAGYLYQAKTFHYQIPLYAALILFLISTGALCAHADQGFMEKITSDSFGGIMARRLLPATLLMPLVLGWLQQRGLRAGLYTTEPGLAFFAVANVVVFVAVVWWGVSSLHRMDTKRRQTENELKATAAKLARSNADLEQFAYVASHDLKEPLRAISGSVQILQEHYRNRLGTEADEVIKHTVDGATRMQTLIDDLLTYSRLTSREAPIELTDSNLVMQEVLANLERAIGESKAVVTNDPLPVVKADRTQLLQVFQNLISNGIKYRSERTPKIHVSAEDNGGEWLFAFRDNGIGISPQYADRIFRIFQRLHTRKEYPGTGIGLAVCKKIVERHGGRIWVESEPEEGSTFYFTMPK